MDDKQDTVAMILVFLVIMAVWFVYKPYLSAIMFGSPAQTQAAKQKQQQQQQIANAKKTLMQHSLFGQLWGSLGWVGGKIGSGVKGATGL